MMYCLTYSYACLLEADTVCAGRYLSPEAPVSVPSTCIATTRFICSTQITCQLEIP